MTTTHLLLAASASTNLVTGFLAYIICTQKNKEAIEAKKRAFVYRNELKNILGLETINHIDLRNQL